MDETKTVSGRKAGPSPGFAEFVLLIAGAMALVSLSIDNVLPAFGPIGEAFGIADANDLQLLVYVYMGGFAVGQLVFGPLSDVVGRRKALLSGLVIYAIGALGASWAGDFSILLVARAVQGFGGAAARVITLTVVRDRYEGHEMARVMSLVMMVFLTAPVFAPALGSLMLVLGGWRLVFDSMLALGGLLAVACYFRLPETLNPAYVMKPSVKEFGRALRAIFASRAAVGYSAAVGFMFGGLMGYIGSSQQILETGVYALGPLFPLAFGALAGVMVIASIISARIVRRLGMRRLAHLSLMIFTGAAVVLVVLSLVFAGRPPFAAFALMLAAVLFAFAIAMPNFGAISMEDLGPVAGTASSVIGSSTTVVGAGIGAVIGLAFDGTVLPLGLGFLLTGLLGIAAVAWAEHGRLFGGR